MKSCIETLPLSCVGFMLKSGTATHETRLGTKKAEPFATCSLVPLGEKGPRSVKALS